MLYLKMNSNKEICNDERMELLQMIKSLESTSEANTHIICSYKSKLGTINDQLEVKNKLLDFYEKKLEEIMTEIGNIEWSQIKAKTVLKADIEFAEKFKIKTGGNEQNTIEFEEDNNISNKIAKLKLEKDNLELQCKTNNEIIVELFSELEKLKEDCEINNVNTNCN